MEFEEAERNAQIRQIVASSPFFDPSSRRSNARMARVVCRCQTVTDRARRHRRGRAPSDRVGARSIHMCSGQPPGRRTWRVLQRDTQLVRRAIGFIGRDPCCRYPRLACARHQRSGDLRLGLKGDVRRNLGSSASDHSCGTYSARSISARPRGLAYPRKTPTWQFAIFPTIPANGRLIPHE